MLIASFDVSMTATGCVLVDYDLKTNKFDLLDAKVLTTKKNETSEKVSSTLDSVRRAAQVGAAVAEFVRDPQPTLITVEGMSWPRNASSAIKMALVWGAISEILVRYPLIEVGPQDIKIACSGIRSATKEEVASGVRQYARHPLACQEVLQSYVPKKALHEHCWDAMGAVIAASKTQKFGLLTAVAR
jgi:Holliday junction resolvasome RuvABC endonuclease subunit